MQLDLTIEEINFTLQVFGDLPAKSGVWPLLQKIQQQAQAQAQAKSQQPEPEVVADAA